MATRLGADEVLVVDCQSTGSTPAHGHPIELGFRRFRCDEVELDKTVAHVVNLPDGAHVPRMVSRLTGLTERDVRLGVPAEAAWRSLRDAADSVRSDAERSFAPTVIHFAQFEERFLRDLHQTYDAPFPFTFEVVCTHAIARRLLPDLPRRGLRALAGYFGYSATQLRRSADHVDATCFVWRHLVQVLEQDEDICTWDELKAWLSSSSAPRARGRSYPMPKAKRQALPDRPGVYRFLRTGGDILYVGKATSLKKRVNSHFVKNKTDRALEMLTQARDLSYTETATALEAALLESDEIKENDPPYNVALLEERRSVWFASRDLERWSRDPNDEHCVGPFPSNRSLLGHGAIHRLLVDRGEDPPSPFVIASALGIMPASAPDAPCFLEGFESFRMRYFADGVAPSLQQILQLARRLAARLEVDARPKRVEDEVEWDADRVREHLEEALSRTPQLVARARWLCHITDATLDYTEPSGSALRRLVLDAGRVVQPTTPSTRMARPLRDRQRLFDVATYDRLRVLTTELKRVIRDGGTARIDFNGRVMLEGVALRRSLNVL